MLPLPSLSQLSCISTNSSGVGFRPAISIIVLMVTEQTEGAKEGSELLGGDRPVPVLVVHHEHGLV